MLSRRGEGGGGVVGTILGDTAGTVMILLELKPEAETAARASDGSVLGLVGSFSFSLS